MAQAHSWLVLVVVACDTFSDPFLFVRRELR